MQWPDDYNFWGSLSEHTFWIGQIVAILLLMGFAGWYVHRLFGALEKRFARSRVGWDSAMLLAARSPARWLIWIVGITWILQILNTAWPIPLLDAGRTLRRTVVIVLLAWFLLGFVKQLRASVPADNQLARAGVIEAGVRMAQLAIVIIAFLVILQTHGYSIASILAFGGIGGIAIGLAAKDMLANVFGGLMLHLDRPFHIGERIRFVNGSIEGAVEAIGWRQTRIRTPDRKPVYVPNALFTSHAVENFSRMDNRRIQVTVGLRYDDLNKLEVIAAEIEGYLKQHPGIDNRRILQVSFSQYGESTIDLLIDCFTRTTALVEYRAVKQQILLKAGQVIHQADADFAFPTRTIEGLITDKPMLQE
ncbi:mechanosensitive ion channel family protein [Kistimonas scapharcae]|uniref:Mechanosensitive ion channel family protein n=1 Tax=Kistimonas scapharcae TaxID=1036133 RepID=A0ABP8V2L3_9GAMM